MSESTEKENKAVESLLRDMPKGKRAEMGKLLAAELKRRESSHKGKAGTKPRGTQLGENLSREQVKELYAQYNKSLEHVRSKKAAEAAKSKKRGVRQVFLRLRKRLGDYLALREKPELLGRLTNYTLVAVIVGLGVLKLALEIRTSEAVEPTRARLSHSSIEDSTPMPRAVETISPVERELLTKLDERRVLLEQRELSLAERERELDEQEGAIAERLGRLKTLLSESSEQRSRHEKQRDQRFEQLASVYGSMAPKDAAQLIEQLEDSIALRLLEQLPGKRTGQILSLMNPQRAIALTRQLSLRGSD